MFIDKYVQLRWDEIVDEEYSIDELVDLAEGREIQLGSYLKEKPKGWCGWPTNTNSPDLGQLTQWATI